MATQNQIKLREVLLEEAKLEEDKRHHLAEESINSQHFSNQDIASLMQAQASRTQADVATSRLSIEWYDAATKRAQQAEQARHDVATEILESQRLEEIERHNRVGEQQEWSSLGLRSLEIDVSKQRADTAQYEAETGRKQYDLNKDYYTMEKWRLGKDFANTALTLNQNSRKLDQGDRALDLKEQELGLKYKDTPSTDNHSGGGGRQSSNGIFGEVGDRVDSIIRAITGQE